MEQMLFEQKQNILVSMHAIKQRIKSVLQQDNNKKKKKNQWSFANDLTFHD